MSLFDYKPHLIGDRLSLKPLEFADFDGLYAVANDPLLWALHPSKDRYKVEVFSTYFDEALASNTALIARDNTSNAIIGTSRYHGLDRALSEIEIGWSFLARSHWGGIYNGEMKDLMLKHAFQWVQTVLLIIGEDNLRSQGAAEKIGGTLRKKTLQRGQLVNVVYEINREKYLNAYPSKS